MARSTLDKAVCGALATLLRGMRERGGWAMVDVAQRLRTPVTYQCLQQWEVGTHRFDLGRFVEWCLVLRVRPGDVLTMALAGLDLAEAQQECRAVSLVPSGMRPAMTAVLDIQALRTATDPRLAPLARWADGAVMLLASVDAHAFPTLDGLEWAADLCGIELVDLINALRAQRVLTDLV